MHYIKCTLCNFSWNNKLFVTPIPILLGRVVDDAFLPFRLSELNEIIEFLKNRGQNFHEIDVVSEKADDVDIFDKLRSSEILPDKIDFNSPLLNLMPNSNVSMPSVHLIGWIQWR